MVYGRTLRIYQNEKGEWAETHIFYDEQIDDSRYDHNLSVKLYCKKMPWYFTRYGQRIGQESTQLTRM